MQSNHYVLIGNQCYFSRSENRISLTNLGSVALSISLQLLEILDGLSVLYEFEVSHLSLISLAVIDLICHIDSVAHKMYEMKIFHMEVTAVYVKL